MTDWNEIDARRQARTEREQRAAQSVFHAIPLEPTEQQVESVISSLNRFATEAVNADRQAQEQDLREQLTESGVEVSTAQYSGNSSYPTEYTIKYGDVQVTGPTFDLALVAFTLQLLPPIRRRTSANDKQRRDIDAVDAEEQARQDWSNDE